MHSSLKQQTPWRLSVPGIWKALLSLPPQPALCSVLTLMYLRFALPLSLFPLPPLVLQSAACAQRCRFGNDEALFESAKYDYNYKSTRGGNNPVNRLSSASELQQALRFGPE